MLVEDHPDFRRLMKGLLGGQPDIELVAQAGSLAEARKHVAVVRFDVVVLDLSLPDGNGVDLIADLHRQSPDVAVLILSATLDPAIVDRAAEAGADEIMDKLARLDEILDTVRRLGACKRPGVRGSQVRPSPTTLLLLRTSTAAAGEIQVRGVFADVLAPQILNREYPGCMNEEQWPLEVGVLDARPISQAAPRRQTSATRKGTSCRSARGRFASS
jgi:DNA-binding NarL/FixJ family response regulator